MDTISLLPTELLEEIFQYLNSDDLVRCSYVSWKWREVINSNKIWSIQCRKEWFIDKEYLQSSSSLIHNPLKVYKEHVVDVESSRFTAPCHWRSHYNRYKFLQRNWRKGNYSLIRTKVSGQHYTDGMLISIDQNKSVFTAYRIQDLQTPINVRKVSPFSKVDNVIVKDGLLFYSQSRQLICSKLQDNSYVKLFEITVPESMKQHSNHTSPNEPILSIKITDKFLVIQDLTSACYLYFYNYKTGQLLKELNLHTYTGVPCPRFMCLEACGDKVFIAYAIGLLDNYIQVYDFKTDTADVKVETLLPTSELVASNNFFCSKLKEELVKSCGLHVWSVHGFQVGDLSTNRHLPVILTPDDRLIHSEHLTVYVRGLVNFSKDAEFSLQFRIEGMKYVFGDFLVINLGISLELWDMTAGEKLHTYLRHSIDDVWVDDRHIVVRMLRNSWSLTLGGIIIGFW